MGSAVLRTGEWDAVIDNSGYVPSACAGFGKACWRPMSGRYVYISSVSVYADFSVPNARRLIARDNRGRNR